MFWTGFRIRTDLMRIRIRLFSNCGSGFRIPDPDPWPGSRVWWPKIEKNLELEIYFLFFWSIIAIYLSLGLHKGHPSYRRSLQPSKENIQYLKTWKFLTFFYFCGSFLPSWIWIRIQQLKLMRIHADPDPKPWFWSAGCSLVRAEGLSCSLCVLYGDLGISKLQFLKKNKQKVCSCKFFTFLVIKPWIQIRN